METINNVERKTSQGSESQMVGKVVVTCEVSIYGLGTHSGIGEAWAEASGLAVVGEARYTQLRQELNFAGAHLDDIPDREPLRKAVETLEAEAVLKTAKVSPGSTANGAAGSSNAQASNAPTAKELGETRFALVREAQRVEGLKEMKVDAVVDRAAKGAFTYQQIKQLTPDYIPALKAATDVLRQVTS